MELLVCKLGLVEYTAAAALQERLREGVQAGAHPEVLLLLEHPPVYTLGRRSEPSELPMAESWYRAQGIDIVRTTRGGKITYHGPGQLVGYPILRTDDVASYVRTLEEAIVETLALEGIQAHRRPGVKWTGAWVGERKIASIGVHISRGVTMHGFAVNVDDDLRPFEWVVACGLGDVRMTSICAETGRPGGLDAFAERIADAICAAFGRERVDGAPADVRTLAATATVSAQ